MTGRPPLARELLALQTGDDCPVCALVGRAVRGHLVAYAVEGVNDLAIRGRLRASRGYCARHATIFWQEVRHQLGVALIYQDVVINLIRALEAVDPTAASPLDRLMTSLGAPRARAAADADALAPQATCPACDAEADAERRVTAELLHQLRLTDFLAAYDAGPGLCLPHFRRALADARHNEQITALVQTQLRVWRALHADLTEYIRLQDYRFRDEPRGPEQVAPGQAIESIAGAPGAATRTNEP
ncbi:MAG: hypothetical protein IT340_06715 [Chloroflexi bacterium]|nr:hypothetical protein [Chloroflexota bacterium]